MSVLDELQTLGNQIGPAVTAAAEKLTAMQQSNTDISAQMQAANADTANVLAAVLEQIKTALDKLKAATNLG